MKKTDFNGEISGMSLDDLKKKVQEIQEELLKLRFRKRVSGQLDQTHRLKELSRNLARVKTKMNAAA